MDLFGSVTSCGRSRQHCRVVARVHDRRGGASGCRGGCQRSQPAVGP
jgi:hypothetical protein